MRRDRRESRRDSPALTVSESDFKRERSQKILKVVGVVVVTAAISGLFMGLLGNASRITQTRPVSTTTEDSARRAEEGSGEAVKALPYWDVDRRIDGANAGWVNVVSNLEPVPIPRSDTAPASEEARAAAITLRAQRRAFDGAPPVIPHPIQQNSSAQCLACHANGLMVKDRVTSRISHPHFANCTQCHVPALAPDAITEPALLVPIAANSFVGSKPFPGQRAYDGAPPTIPHPTAMRSDCMSCHGPAGVYGLRTSHPDRQSCVQCHAPTANLEQGTVSAR